MQNTHFVSNKQRNGWHVVVMEYSSTEYFFCIKFTQLSFLSCVNDTNVFVACNNVYVGKIYEVKDFAFNFTDDSINNRRNRFYV